MYPSDRPSSIRPSTEALRKIANWSFSILGNLLCSTFTSSTDLLLTTNEVIKFTQVFCEGVSFIATVLISKLFKTGENDSITESTLFGITVDIKLAPEAILLQRVL